MKNFGRGLLRVLTLVVHLFMPVLPLYLLDISFLNASGVPFVGVLIALFLLSLRLLFVFGVKCLGLDLDDPFSDLTPPWFR